MTKNEMLTLFHRTIIADTKMANELMELLQSVRLSCIQMDGESLQKINDNVVQHIGDLEKNHLRRLKVVNAFGFSQNIDAFVTALPAKIKTEIAAKLKKLTISLQQCKQSNQNNGQLFSEQHELVQKLTEASLSIRV